MNYWLLNAKLLEHGYWQQMAGKQNYTAHVQIKAEWT